MPQCPTCGSIVPEQADVCDNCGMELTHILDPKATIPSVTPLETESSIPTNKIQEWLFSSDEKPAHFSNSAQIILKRNNQLTAEIFPLKECSIVGRFDRNTGPVDIDLGRLPEGEYVSRRHAEIRCDTSGKWLIKDLGSSNKTYIKAVGESQLIEVVGERVINDQDEITLGNARFEFRLN